MARLEIEISAKGAASSGTEINKVAGAVSSLEKQYERLANESRELYNEQRKLQTSMQQLSASFNVGAISEAKFESESAKLSTQLTAIGGNIQQVQSRMTSLRATMNQAANSSRSFGNETKKLQAYADDFTSGIRSANTVSVEFSRIIQDAPYGMRGVANNIQQLTQNWGHYTRAAREAAAATGQAVSTKQLLGGAFRAMLSPVNLLTLGISAVTAGWVAYERWQQRANKEARENAKATKDASTELREYIDALDSVSRLQSRAAEGYAQETAKAKLLYERTQDLTLSTKERVSAVNELKKAFPAYFSGLSNEAVLAGNAADEYKRLTENLIASATARASEDLIGDAIKERINLRIQENNRAREILSLNQQIANINKQIYDATGARVEDLKDYQFGQVVEAKNNKTILDLVREREAALNKVVEIGDQTNESTNRQIGLQSDINTYQEEYNKASAEILATMGRFSTENKKVKDDSEKIANNFANALSSLQGMSSAAQDDIDVMVRSGLDADDEKTKQKYDKLGEDAGNAFLAGLNNAAGDPSKIEEITKAYEHAFAMIETQRATEHEQNALKYVKTEEEALKVSLDLQRRLVESQAQIAIRHLNSEYREKEKRLNDWIKQQTEAGRTEVELSAEVARKRYALQEDYYKKISVLSEQDREMNIQASFDGDALSVPIARIRGEMDKLRESFMAGKIGFDEFAAGITQLANKQDVFQAMQKSVDGISSSIGGLFSDAIFDAENATKNLGKAFKNVAASIVSDLIKIATRQAINAAISKAAIASQTTASVSAAATTTAAWTPAAAVSSVASWGGAVAVGGAALLAFLASMRGFRSGGYTGGGREDEIAGVVHGKEFVVNARATRDNMPLLQAINRGADLTKSMVSSRGAVSGMAMPSASGSRMDVYVHGEFDGNALKLVMDRANQQYTRYFGN